MWHARCWVVFINIASDVPVNCKRALAYVWGGNYREHGP
jgi:hypothetical protein